MTTLENSYCVPRTVNERAMFPHLLTEEHYGVQLDNDYGVVCFDEGDWIYENGTEIPVSHFLDILHDRIVPWRLEEVGFVDPFKTIRRRLLTDFHTIDVDEQNVVRIDGGYTYITTFTDLLTLIRMLTPPSND